MRDLLIYWLFVTGTAHGTATDLGRVAILTPPQVQANLGNYSIVDARDDEEFEKGHLPGSVSTAWEDWVQERPGLWNLWFGDPGVWGQVLTPSPRLQRRIEELGVSRDRPILVVGSPQGWGEEGRMAWNFLYWGARSVTLLDGGFAAWQRTYPKQIETGRAKSPEPGTFPIQLRPARRIRRQQLAQELSAHQLIDVRTPEEWKGKKVRGQARGGHLPGAIFVPHRALTAPDGTYVTREKLHALLGKMEKKPVAYCVGGVRSALMALLVEARLGTVVANYDGSMWDWSSDPALPLE